MTRLLLAAAAVLVLPAVASAKPAHKQALAAHLGPFLPKALGDCRLCHVNAQPGADEDMPRNPFGERLEDKRKELRDAGKPTDIPARFDAVAAEDTDNDGVPNLIEVLTGRRPGDKTDVPTKDEVAAATETMPKYRKFLASYPWRPFEVVKRPAVPAVKDAAWAGNPIDAFVAAEHADRGLAPRPEADRRTLLLRVTLDLTGLPPTPEELRVFLADTSPGAYEKAVDRLLASPRYGERWGRHWMDVWRYSDWAGWTGGNQIRDSQPHIWRWRDWIVESLNADKGYDRMVVEMLAADELTPDDPDALRATGYLVRNYKMLSREKWLQDTVDHTFLAFQGVTAGCARCHDHMYDPIPQREYYQIRAVFEPHRVRLDRVPGETDTTKNGLARAYDADLAVPTYLFERGDERSPDKSAALPPGALAAYGPKFPDVTPVKLPPGAVSPDARDFVIRDELAAADAAVASAQKTRDRMAAVAGLVGPAAARFALPELDLELATAKRDSLKATVEADRSKADVAMKAAAAAQKHAAVLIARRMLMTAAANKRKEAEAALAKAEAAPETFTPRKAATYPAESTGRRLALAKWLTDSQNPLTARVAVNHVWLRHFGQAVVPSVFDFGRNGRRPTHPALLDWLAAELVEHNWSMKHLHRLMVTSRTYRLASTPDTADLARDPDNQFLWRFAPRRLEAEAVRDRLLFAAGKLDLTMGGPDLDPARGFDLPRRSLYFRHAHERQMEFLKLFDTAGVTECYQRRESVVPQQALALANSPLAADMAKWLAADLSGAKTGDAKAFAAAAFEHVLGRPPTAEEAAECVAFLSANGNDSSPARRRELLVLVLFNHNEFVTLR